ncbi:MAG: hypothetical protein ACFUZC_05130 [Chthoniobacteraceae bacterium]
MKSILAIAGLLLAGCSSPRVIAGKLVYQESGQPAKDISVEWQCQPVHPVRYPGLFCYFIFPRKYDGVVTSDHQGRFEIRTIKKHPVVIRPEEAKAKHIVIRELTDNLLSSEEDIANLR